MKILILYYSRTGTTRSLANYLANKLKCDHEEIIDTVDRSGPIGYLLAGKDATLRRLTKIKKFHHDPKRYDLVILGMPVWAYKMPPAIRSCLKYLDKEKNFAFFATQGSNGADSTFKELEQLLKNPAATLVLTTAEVRRFQFKQEAALFIKKIQKYSASRNSRYHMCRP